MTDAAAAHWTVRGCRPGCGSSAIATSGCSTLGQLVSLAGTWMQAVAQDWLVLQLTNDPVALGVVAAAQFLPVMVLGLFGGPRRRRAAQAAVRCCAPRRPPCASPLVLGLLVLLGHVQVWQVMVMAFLLGIVNAFDMPIRQSFVVEMVGRSDVASAVALNSAAFNAARIVGPAIAGLLIGVIGIAPLFLLNAAELPAAHHGIPADGRERAHPGRADACRPDRRRRGRLARRRAALRAGDARSSCSAS